MQKLHPEKTNSKFLRFVGIYLLLFLPFFTLISLVWYRFVDGALYFCTDSVPFLDFFPPFMHGARFGDRWIAPMQTVYILWCILLLSSLSFPILVMLLARYRKRIESNKTLLIASAIVVVVEVLFVRGQIQRYKQHGIPDGLNQLVAARPRDRVVTYVVVPGDTLRGISEKFSISVDTIRGANALSGNSIVPGSILRILPVTGVEHVVAKGDTIQTVATKYNTSPQNIIDYPYNVFEQNTQNLIVGTTIMVPDGTKP